VRRRLSFVATMLPVRGPVILQEKKRKEKDEGRARTAPPSVRFNQTVIVIRGEKKGTDPTGGVRNFVPSPPIKFATFSREKGEKGRGGRGK